MRIVWLVLAAWLAGSAYGKTLPACACSPGQVKRGCFCPVTVPTTAQEITREATAPNSETNHPLPLMGSWSASTQWDAGNLGYTPSWQLQMIEQGHHLLPWFDIPTADMLYVEWASYYQTALQNAAALNLPISFVGTQWEQNLYLDPQYFNLPSATNPNVVAPDGTVQRMASPFGPVGPWQSVGAAWGSSPIMQQLQAWYPSPPLVLFISNNEALKLQWIDAERDQRYLALYGIGQTDEFKREKVAEGWVDRYREMQQAWRNALSWSSVKFVGYEAFGPKHFARWGGWQEYALYNTNRIDPSPLTWDGGSPSYYMAFNNPGRDDVAFSAQVEAMNYDFMLKEAYRLNPEFWYELSTWNGCDVYPTDAAYNSDCASLAANIPGYTPARYGGGVQFGMWLTRPRVVRDFRGWAEPRAQSQPYVDVLMAAVDRVYANPTLMAFWRRGELVANTSRPHPYQASVPSEYQSLNRMFMLTTNLDPPQPWGLTDVVPVFVLARVMGTAPQRTWLLYAFSPNQDRAGVVVTIPGVGNTTIGATVAGSFYIVPESTLIAAGI